MPKSSSRSYSSPGKREVAISNVFLAGALHHGGRAVRRLARSSGVSACQSMGGPKVGGSRLRMDGLSMSNPSSRRYGIRAGKYSALCPSESITG